MIDVSNPPRMLTGDKELAQYLGRSLRFVSKMNKLGVYDSARHRDGVRNNRYDRLEIDRITKFKK